MHAVLAVLSLALVLALAPMGPAAAAAPIAAGDSAPESGEVIPGAWIVQVRRSADLPAVALEAEQLGAVVTARYRNAVPGFAARMTRPTALRLRRHAAVTAVTPDRVIAPLAARQSASWGLDRIDQRRGLDLTQAWEGTGKGVHVYVLDTGVRADHVDFGGRVLRGFDATGRGSTGDCDGHGTHVAGTVAGDQHGVAKRATVIPVRVLDCQGNGRVSWMLRGLDWIVRHHVTSQPAVANMSLGTSADVDPALDRAVRAVIRDGVTVVAAAGNEGADACRTTPAGVPGAITVGATNRSDRVERWSNWGTCVDLLAPGTSIVSPSIAGRRAVAVRSGTSMAAPHAAGAAAVYLAQHRTATPEQVRRHLIATSTKDVLAGLRGATPNRLLHQPGQVPTAIAVAGPGGPVAIGSPVSLTVTMRNTVTSRPIAGRDVVFAWTDGSARQRVVRTDATGRAVFTEPAAKALTYRVNHLGTTWTKPSARTHPVDARSQPVATRAIKVEGGGWGREVITAPGVPVEVSATFVAEHSGAPLRGAAVWLERRLTHPAGAVWQRHPLPAVTDAAGAVSFRSTAPGDLLVPPSASEFRLRIDATSSSLGRTTGSLTANVLTATLSAAELRADGGREVTIAGSLGRDVPGWQARGITVESSSDVPTVAGSQLRFTAASTLAGTVTLDGACGTTTLRLRIADAATNRGGVSAPLPLTVVGCEPQGG